MSQQYPQQPGQFPQQQPGWGAPTQPGWGAPAQPPKKRNVGKILGLGCAGVFGFIVVITVIAAVATSGGNKTSSASSGTVAASHDTSTKGTAKTGGSDAKASSAPSKKASHTVEFKVWGTAPAGALGGLDIQYGSDTDTRKGTFKGGKFEATLPLNKDAMYYQLNAQLQGSGDINCSVTVDGHTKTGHASGGYNICMAQLNSGLFGDWS
ncbi:hypothetical protein ACWCRD_02890 [Streptomyces sp. NPDC002092]